MQKSGPHSRVLELPTRSEVLSSRQRQATSCKPSADGVLDACSLRLVFTRSCDYSVHSRIAACVQTVWSAALCVFPDQAGDKSVAPRVACAPNDIVNWPAMKTSCGPSPGA